MKVTITIHDTDTLEGVTITSDPPLSTLEAATTANTWAAHFGRAAMYALHEESQAVADRVGGKVDTGNIQ